VSVWLYHVAFSFRVESGAGSGDFLFESPCPLRSSADRAPVLEAVVGQVARTGQVLVGSPTITSLTLVCWPGLPRV
jgi:hypothetical protein